ncbi:MAG TPA: hypothetical protein VJC39_03395 [Candidatus Nanoarchaeia archaeon]|nr:hypothetical protein [Candidatus Nanoarchaeia archaeon]
MILKNIKRSFIAGTALLFSTFSSVAAAEQPKPAPEQADEVSITVAVEIDSTGNKRYLTPEELESSSFKNRVKKRVVDSSNRVMESILGSTLEGDLAEMPDSLQKSHLVEWFGHRRLLETLGKPFSIGWVDYKDPKNKDITQAVVLCVEGAVSKDLSGKDDRPYLIDGFCENAEAVSKLSQKLSLGLNETPTTDHFSFVDIAYQEKISCKTNDSACIKKLESLLPYVVPTIVKSTVVLETAKDKTALAESSKSTSTTPTYAKSNKLTILKETECVGGLEKCLAPEELSGQFRISAGPVFLGSRNYAGTLIGGDLQIGYSLAGSELLFTLNLSMYGARDNKSGSSTSTAVDGPLKDRLTLLSATETNTSLNGYGVGLGLGHKSLLWTADILKLGLAGELGLMFEHARRELREDSRYILDGVEQPGSEQTNKALLLNKTTLRPYLKVILPFQAGGFCANLSAGGIVQDSTVYPIGGITLGYCPR